MRLSRRSALQSLLAGAAGALVPARRALAQSPTQPSGPGPWDNDVNLWRLWPDGTREQLAVFERAGVPTLARLADRRLIAAFQWFPLEPAEAFDTIAVACSEDDGLSWSPPRTISLQGLPAGYRFPFDPTLLALPDGRVRLYVTLNRGRTFQDATPRIGSLISMDGVAFALEGGDRLAIPGTTVIDCAAVRHGDLTHLYSPVQGATTGYGYHAVSRDGLGFERQGEVFVAGGARWLGCAVSDGARIRFYGTGDRGLWVAESEDGFHFGPAAWFTLPGADPGVVEEPDGSRLVLATGPPRSALAARRRIG